MPVESYLALPRPHARLQLQYQFTKGVLRKQHTRSSIMCSLPLGPKHKCHRRHSFVCCRTRPHQACSNFNRKTFDALIRATSSLSNICPVSNASRAMGFARLLLAIGRSEGGQCQCSGGAHFFSVMPLVKTLVSSNPHLQAPAREGKL